MPIKTQRQMWADNAKYIGIALMVLGRNLLASLPLNDFIYSFTCHCFFVVGILCIDKNSSFLLFPFYILGYAMSRYTSMIAKMESSSTVNIALLAANLFVLTYFMSSMNGHEAASCGGYVNHP